MFLKLIKNSVMHSVWALILGPGAAPRIALDGEVFHCLIRNCLISVKSPGHSKKKKKKSFIKYGQHFTLVAPCMAYFSQARWSSPGGSWACSQCVGGGPLSRCRAGSSPLPAQPPSGGAGSPALLDAAAAAPVAPAGGGRVQTPLRWTGLHSAEVTSAAVRHRVGWQTERHLNQLNWWTRTFSVCTLADYPLSIFTLGGKNWRRLHSAGPFLMLSCYLVSRNTAADFK